MKNMLVLAFVIFLVGCHSKSCSPVTPGGTSSTVSIVNGTDTDATVYVAFGSDSAVTPASWTFCTGSGLVCSFPLAKRASQALPLGGQYLNATFAFNSPVGCNATKAEVNTNNPKWYSILDVSLVDGYSNNIAISVGPVGDAGQVTLGPPVGKTGNEKIVGVFPFGCDICVARQNPPCGISKGTDGCKSGTQYNPDVICQYQGTLMGGGESITVTLQ